MSIFADYAARYFESGYSVIPIDGKKPILKDWQLLSDNLPTQDQINEWEKQYPNHNIGLVCGKASNIIVLDFDYEGSDYEKVENILKELIPPSPIRKRGRKGWSAFYRYNGISSTFINRGNHRLVDILSNNKQTVIPPSIHPETKSQYSWTTEETLLDIDQKDLPELTETTIHKIRDLSQFDFNDENNAFNKINGRHDVLATYGWAIIEKCKSQEELALKLIERDKKLFSQDRYLTNKKYFPNKNEMQAALEIVKKLEKTVINNKRKNNIAWKIGENLNKDDQNTSEIYEKYKSFFIRKMPGIQKCKITKEYLYREGNHIVPVLNNISALRADAICEELPKAHVEDMLYKYLKEIPETFGINFEQWDGFDYIEEICKSLIVKNYNSNEISEIFKEWFAGIFKRLDDSLYQNKMIILKGNQGIGKDTFINNLFSCLNYYFLNIEIGNNEKDIYDKLEKALVINISEFDRSSKLNSATIKNMITVPFTTYRKPYARVSTTSHFHCSFISSCNLDDILGDETGNRRFILLDVDRIEWNYLKGCSSQIFAQAKVLAENNFKMSEDLKNKISLEMDKHIPFKMDDLILQEYNNRCTLLSLALNKTEFIYTDISHIILDIKSIFNLRNINKILNLLKRRGLSNRTKLGVTYTFIKNLDLKIDENNLINFNKVRK